MRTIAVVNRRARAVRDGTFDVRSLEGTGSYLSRILAVDELERARPVLEGVERVICIGGDGTLHTLIDVLSTTDRLGSIEIVVARAGTINFVHGYLRARERHGVRERETPTLSVTLDGRTRIAFATAIGGVGSRFFDAYLEAPSGKRRVASIIAGGVRDALRPDTNLLFRGDHARVSIDGVLVEDGGRALHALHATSIPLDLGVVKMFPHVDSTRFGTQVGSASALRIAMTVPRLLRGAPLAIDGVFDGSASELVAEATTAPFHPVFDGERFERGRVVRVVPGPVLTLRSLASLRDG